MDGAPSCDEEDLDCEESPSASSSKMERQQEAEATADLAEETSGKGGKRRRQVNSTDEGDKKRPLLDLAIFLAVLAVFLSELLGIPLEMEQMLWMVLMMLSRPA